MFMQHISDIAAAFPAGGVTTLITCTCKYQTHTHTYARILNLYEPQFEGTETRIAELLWVNV